MENIENYTSIAIEKIAAYLPSIVGAIIAVILGLWIIKFLTNKIRKMLTKREVEPAITGFTVNLLNIGLKILLFIIVITKLGVETTSFAALIASAGLAVGLALQGSLSNFAGGVLIILLKPFKVGDFIEGQGESGTVEEISLFYTHLITINNQRIVIPNGQLSNNKVINYSSEETRRQNMTIGISYDSDIEVARKTLLKIVEGQEKILKDPAPVVLVSELADSSVNLSLRYWTKTSEFWPIHFEVMEQAKIQLEAAGCSIPFPQHDVHLFKENS
ncbi:MAG: mechanosensitive ion channel family protein [Bacteroidota bacterium]